MSKTQFWALQAMAILLALLVLVNLSLNIVNRGIAEKIQKTEVQMANFPNLQSAARNLISKIAQYSKDDAQLRDLLAKYNIKVQYDAPAGTANSEVRP